MKRYLYIYSILLAVLLPVALLADNYIIINQVMYDARNDTASVSNGEFIELYNAGNDTVCMEGWQLTGDGATEKITFPNISIPNGAYLNVACRRGDPNFRLDSIYTLPVGVSYSIYYQNKIMLRNDGENITLINAQNDTIDRMYYDGESNASNPDRLYAPNTNGTPGDSCRSLHRTWVEFDENGKAVAEASRWQADRVSFNVHKLPYDSYSETSLIGNHFLPDGTHGTGSENYRITITPLDPTARISTQNGRLSISSDVRARTTIQYMDGLGRVDEIIQLGVTPQGKDLVTVTAQHDNVLRQWIPVVMQTEGQRALITDVQEQATEDYGERPYAETKYERANHQVKQYLPGESYVTHPKTQTNGFNGANEVLLLTVCPNGKLHSSGTYYAQATLYKTIATDEDGKSVITYTDVQGKKIMDKHGDSEVYYTYDELGRLRYTLPNMSSKLTTKDYPLDDNILKAYAYCYKYDSLGNMIYKRLPGCEPQLMVYDKLGKLVLRQDGNQRAADKWTMCTYDSLGRNLSTTEITASQSHAQLISAFADTCYVAQYGSNPRPLTVSYYDNYDFLNALTDDLSFVQNSGYDQPYENATGLLTGTRVYNLSENGYTVTALYYDAKGRIVQNRSTNHNGGITTGSVAYLFDGSIAQQSIVQSMDTISINEHYRYEYDHAGRAKISHYQLNNDAEIKISEFSYDSIGRLVQFLLHENRDMIKYAYDMRNMLTETRNKHFSERLYYVDSLPQTATACYNGNIAAARIAQQDTAYTFTYQYDQLNRLTSSNRLTEYGSMFSEQFTYDPAGNILSLKRFNDNRMIDNLSYSYGNEGNQLLSIADNGQDADLYEVIEYHNAPVQADTTMRYDANGNIIYDADREISAIHYNILNLPDTIQFINGGQIVNFYDAVGRKYKSITYTNIASVIPQQYDFAHYSFETDSIDYLVTEYSGNIETRYSRMDTTMRIHNAIGYYTDSTYYHYIKDHLGNVCAVVNSTADTCIQSTLYYASGVPMAQSANRDKQPYLYNGKEFVEAHGINTYDYGFRGYYASIGRFTSIDPLAEQTPWQSPYVYANNDFINKIDFMGLSGGDGFAHDLGDVFLDDGGYGLGDNDFFVFPWSWSLLGGLVDVCNWAAIDGFGNLVGWGNDNDDWHVYRVDGKWDGTYAGLEGHSTIVGWEILDDYGNQPRYVKGEPAYWLGAVQTSAYMNGETYIIGSKALMYGNHIVDNSNIIDSNVDAVLHYYFGGGRSIQNGPTALAGFFSTPEYHLIIHNIAQGITHGIIPVEMQDYMFHIGTTFSTYHVNGSMVVIAFAIYDSFSDPNYWKENNYKAKGIDLTDGLGPNLELGGTPYNYIPTVFVIR